jgi:formate dehydrogenase subunit beta
MISLDRLRVAALVSDGNDVKEMIVSLLEKALREGVFDAVLVPLVAPGRDSYDYVLVRNPSLLKGADPIPPVVPVSGGKALMSVARRGTGGMRIAAIMRPCEIRAAIELVKLGQIDLKGITLIGMDCPGALPLQDFVKSPEEGEEKFKTVLRSFDDDGVRPVCRMCRSSATLFGDLHFGFVGLKDRSCFLLSQTAKGNDALDRMSLGTGVDASAWARGFEGLSARREARRTEMLGKLTDRVFGTERLLSAFGDCINCHNCMRVCPICYCRVCGFDSQRGGHPAVDYFQRAQSKGSLRLPADTMLFHLGRMAHMSLSCVSCGACEDACPASIPIAQIFSLVGDRAQRAFDYFPGSSVDDAIPLLVCREEEFEGDDENG